jgi:tetratricopeptide (TPR) repeat protein
VDDLAAIDAELDVARKSDDNAARVRLIRGALALQEAQPLLAEYLDELAYAYEQLDRFDEAVDAMRQAVAAGWDGELDDYPNAEALIADLLLRAGRRSEADDAWLEAERRRPCDPWVHQAAGTAYARAGLRSDALEWQTKGLELALDAGDEQGELVWFLTDERAGSLDELGRPHDELQSRGTAIAEVQERADREYMAELRRRLLAPRRVRQQGVYAGLAWFPAEQYERALEMWPGFAEDYEQGPYTAYCARLELLLRELRAQGTARLALAPIAIDDYLLWCTERDQDPEESDNRAGYATELVRRDIVHPWPPRRNEPCWCGSGTKYKKCCLRAA